MWLFLLDFEKEMWETGGVKERGRFARSTATMGAAQHGEAKRSAAQHSRAELQHQSQRFLRQQYAKDRMYKLGLCNTSLES